MFRRAFSGFPTGRLHKHESPDFLVRRRHETLGIELTELYVPAFGRARADHHRPHQIDPLTSHARRICEQRGVPALSVRLRFERDARWSPPRQNRLAVELADLIGAAVPPPEASFHFNGEDGLPSGVHSIQVERRCGDHLWRPERVGREPAFAGVLTKLVQKKNRKLNRYLRYCDRCWLVIVANERPSSRLLLPGPSELERAWASRFEQTFVMDVHGGQVYELRG